MYLLGNGRVLTCAVGGTLLSEGCLAIEGSTIKAIGTTSVLLQAYPKATFIDAKGGLILPGFINAHNHIYSAFARGISLKNYNPNNFMDILKGLWWHLDAHLTLEDTYLSAKATYLDCIQNGVTTVFDHHASFGAIADSLSAISRAATECHMRTCLCYEVSDRAGEDAALAGILENERFIASCNGNPLQAGMMGAHASFTLSDNTLDACRSHTPADTGFHIHVAEGLDDVHDALRKYGKRVIHRLFDHNILGKHTITGHCIHINPAEMELLKETDTMVVHNPESNMGNAVGAPPCMDMMQRDILLGLGTDGYTNDMLESYKVANILHKHNTCNPNAAWGEVPKMLFLNNAAMAERSFEGSLGTLTVGALADIIVMDYDPITEMTADNATGHLLFGTNGKNVTHTMIHGVPVMLNREVLGIDAPKLMADCRQHATALWQRLNV